MFACGVVVCVSFVKLLVVRCLSGRPLQICSPLDHLGADGAGGGVLNNSNSIYINSTSNTTSNTSNNSSNNHNDNTNTNNSPPARRQGARLQGLAS